jgi:glyoxalase family protein
MSTRGNLSTTKTLTTLGFHHVTLVSGSAPRTLAFYRDLLGLAVVKDNGKTSDPNAYRLYLGDAAGSPGTLITFVERPAAAHGRYGVGGVHHIALGVGTYEAQLKWKRYLTDRGVTVSGPMPRGYFTSLYFRDPDGQVLEIATAGPGYAYDEPIEALGQKIMLPRDQQLPGGRDERLIHMTTHHEPVAVITPDMKLAGIHHITGMTDDIERAGDFYQEALGLSVVKKSVNQDDPDTAHWFWANYDGTRVLPHSSWTLFGWTPRHPHARAGVGQTNHVAFRAADVEELKAWQEHLRSMDLDVSAVIDGPPFASINFRAPDGQLLEIATDGVEF